MYFFYSVNFTFKKLPLFCASVLHMSLALDHVFFSVLPCSSSSKICMSDTESGFKPFLKLYSRPRLLSI